MTGWVNIELQSSLIWQSCLQDEEWAEEGTDKQDFKDEEYALLSEMLGPKGVALDNDELLDANDDDDDLKNDPVSQINLQVIDLASQLWEILFTLMPGLLGWVPPEFCLPESTQLQPGCGKALSRGVTCPS